MNKVENFLKELRDSSDKQMRIFTTGSCFKLYLILKTIFPKAIPYWSDVDGHAITKIGREYYDIGGKLDYKYVSSKGYFRIPENQLHGYSLLKYGKDTPGIIVQKYGY